MKGKKATVVGAALLIATILAACGSKSSSNAAPKQVLHWSEPTELMTNDPAQATDTLSFTMLQNTQEGIYRAADKGTKVDLALAKKVSVSADGKTYQVTLRNAKWSNGQAITAQDFVYGWQRVLDPKSKSQDAFYMYGVKNAQGVNEGKKPLSALGIKANGKSKLTITLSQPVSYFKQLLAWPLFYPQNKAAVTKYGKKYGTSSATQVYSGPFKLAKWDGTSDSWQLVKNNSYWDKRKVKLTTITDQVVKQSNTGLDLFRTGKIDQTVLTGTVAGSQMGNKSRVDRLSSNMTRVDLNQKRQPAFRNVDVRRAFSLAIDRQSLVKNVLRDGSKAALGFTPVGLAQYQGKDFAESTKVPSAVSYNLKEAKALLKKGYKATGVSSLNLTLLTDDTDATKAAGEYLQNALEKLPNVKVTLKAVPKAQRLQLQTSGQFDLTVTAWQSVFGDPINYLDVWESNSTYNWSDWHNAQYDKLLDESENKYGNQPTKRWAKLQQAEELLMKQQATLPLYQANSLQLLNTKVKGINYNPSGVPYDFKETSITK